MADAVGDAHGGPCALSVVIGAYGGVQRHQRGFGIELRCAAEDDLLMAGVGRQVDRAAHGGQRALPEAQLAIDQVFALLGLTLQAILLGNGIGGGEQIGKTADAGHVLPRIGAASAGERAGGGYVLGCACCNGLGQVQAERQMLAKVAAFSDAPPISPPSMSGWANSSAALSARTLPP